jgi:HEAT repeat protein
MERAARDRANSEPPLPGGGRSAPELAVLLLELASVLKARRIFEPGEPKLALVFDRCVRAWRTDLARHGALELELSAVGFREVGGRGVLQHARLGELLAELRSRDLARVRFDPELDGDALAGFVHLLADLAPPLLSGAGFVARLGALVPIGIVAQPGVAPEPAVLPAPDAPPEPPPEPAADPIAATLAVAPTPEALATAEPAPAATPEPDAPTDTAADESDSDTMPIATAPEGSPLDALLGELGDCTSTASYLDLARRAITEAERSRDADSVQRVLATFALHVETKEQRLGEVARSFLASMCNGDALRDLLERVARGSGAEQVQSAQILAAVGEAAVPALLERLPAYPEIVQRERLVPLVLALGERAAPELMRRLATGERELARPAAHILGMMQHPGAVPLLADLAVGGDPIVREEAARALVRIGTQDAVHGLARGLRAERAVVVSAVQHLGGTASASAVAPLGHALERALEAKDVEVAKEILRALGRVGRPEANPIFASVMRRKAGLTGRWLKDIKVAAASALSTVPGDQAVALLAEALQSRDEPLRKSAQRALDRRAEAVTRGARMAQ